MITVSLIAILAVIIFGIFQKQTMKGYDAKRKTDLAKFKVLFEDYYNDHNCYPPKGDWIKYDCKTGANGDFFAPYLAGGKIPCDPQTGENYLYIPIPEDTKEDTCCSGYHLLAALGITTDPDIRASGCDPDPQKGCGWPPYKYNYGISMGGEIFNTAFDFGALPPTPTPEFPPGDNFCLGEPNPARACNTKGGLIAVDYDGKSCSEVLRERGCVSFSNGYTCSQKCQSDYNKYKCQETESVYCR